MSPIIGTPTGAPTAYPYPDDATARRVGRTAPANRAGPLVDEPLGRAPDDACAQVVPRVTGLSDRTTSHPLKQLLGVGPATGQRDRIAGCERLAPGAVEAVSRASASARR